ncbi:MAG TPA: response regulator [Chthoniobacterales bacterium]
MKNQNDETLRQELRLAQLEIKMLREQLLKSVEDVQSARQELEQLSGKPKVCTAPTPSTPAAPARNVIVRLPQKKIAAGNGSARPIGRPRVLYVEDSEPNFRLMENILRDRPNADLVWAETGQKALDLVHEKTPNLVLLDLDLPDIHGSKLLETLQAEPATADTPVIVISADATASQIERMLSAGARNYLTKPFEIRRFLCMFDEILSPVPA